MLISGTVHLARIKVRDAQKISRKTGRGKITFKKKCVNGRTIARPIMKLRKRLVASNGPVVDSYVNENEFQNSIGVKSADKLNDR
jgi:hypothetical protein